MLAAIIAEELQVSFTQTAAPVLQKKLDLLTGILEATSGSTRFFSSTKSIACSPT